MPPSAYKTRSHQPRHCVAMLVHQRHACSQLREADVAIATHRLVAVYAGTA